MKQNYFNNALKKINEGEFEAAKEHLLKIIKLDYPEILKRGARSELNKIEQILLNKNNNINTNQPTVKTRPSKIKTEAKIGDFNLYIGVLPGASNLLDLPKISGVKFIQAEEKSVIRGGNENTMIQINLEEGQLHRVIGLIVIRKKNEMSKNQNQSNTSEVINGWEIPKIELTDLEDARLNEINLIKCITDIVLKILKKTLIHNASLNSALSVIRNEYFLMQTNYSLLEKNISKENFLVGYTAVELDIQGNKDYITLKPSQICEQRLPGEIQGICRIKIFVQGDAEGMLSIGLFTNNHREIQFSKQVGLSGKIDRWISVSPEKALTIPKSTGVLAISWIGKSSIELGLSIACPDEEFLPKVDGVTMGDRVLALIIDKSTPGVHVQ